MSGIRMHLKDTVHFITNRCEQEQLLMLPSSRINQIIGAWFARSLCRVGPGLEVFAFIFLGNHFHLLVRDTQGTLAVFMDYFQGNVARAINKELGRHGKFFAREYDDMIVVGDAEFINRYAYIACNAVKAGLVERADQWPGWSSLDGAINGKGYCFELLNVTRCYKASRFGKKKVNKADFIETWKFELSIPPMWAEMTLKKRASFIGDLVANEEAKYKRAREGKRVLGIKGIRAQRPTDRPQSPARKPRIRFICFNPTMLEELNEGYRQFNGEYREMMGKFHNAAQSKKRSLFEWPEGSYLPSSIRPIEWKLAA
jgi:REP element-mobilizing transposase RayT